MGMHQVPRFISLQPAAKQYSSQLHSYLNFPIAKRIFSVFVKQFLPVIFSSATQCTRGNLCQAGLCFISSSTGLRVCACPQNTGSWNCGRPLSMCTTDCNIKTGIESGVGTCGNALCGSGTCTDAPSYPFYTCTCDGFSTGPNCENEYNPCVSISTNPCGKGTCEFIPGVKRIICTCDEGWKQPDNVPNSILTWPSTGTTQIEIPPACTVQVTYGIARTTESLTTGEVITWWVVLAAI
ncbi:hypothetical protein IE077_001327, partial [Cardiosporidium cionae]